MSARRQPLNLSAIITGACGGIGECFARELASRGCNLVLTDIDTRRLEQLSASLPADITVLTLTVDLTRPDAADRIFRFCDASAISPEILINNAGVFSFCPVAETDDGRVDTFIDLHVRAVAMLSKRFAERRIETGIGYILNMSSMSCWMPMPGIALYSSTKAFIRTFTRALNYEIEDYGLHAMAACPGGIATNLFGLPPGLMKIALALGAVARPEKFTRKAVDRLLKGKRQYINGILNRISIVAVGFTPAYVRKMVKHKMLDKGIKR
ncbi:MAG: SDR family NAD(P)-dependent oxidoreductase [Muribaculaceae bacterium]|nr:SDR family NAD(P)-dependent oxidoreductase [Muribaculaceae bacterium]MDE7109065.1 SDR family NAD(P)-dependent oxidoreductase [Muribaculaceae bacterium]